MVINETTKISALIKASPLVIEALVEFNPHFSKLRNPILRSLLAGRVSIADACKIGRCQINEFFDRMAEIGFVINQSVMLKSAEEPTMEAIDPIFKNDLEIIELDVRPILSQKQDPLKVIIQHIDFLKEGQCLKVINTFVPIPLINLLCKKGFQHRIERPDSETAITFFVKSNFNKTVLESATNQLTIENEDEDFEKKLKTFKADSLRIIDVREMEMPLPMVTILENLLTLQSSDALFVYHKKVPVFLLPELKERGFTFLLQNTPDGKVNMLIYKE